METMKKGRKVWKRALAFMLAVVFVFNAPVVTQAATPKKVVKKVKSAVSSYPFSKSDEVTSRRRVFGIKVNKLKSYKAFQKIDGARDSKSEYILFVAKAKSNAKAKSAVNSLKAFAKSEYENMQNYLSGSGKENFKKAKYGRYGKWVWLVVMKSGTDTEKAHNTIKEKVS